jgi:hypothetical protein
MDDKSDSWLASIAVPAVKWSMVGMLEAVADMIQAVLVPIFLVTIAVGVLHTIALARLTRRLRREYPEVWEQLDKPSFLTGSIRAKVLLLRFCFLEVKSVQSPRELAGLRQLCAVSLLFYGVAFFLLVGMLVTLIARSQQM